MVNCSPVCCVKSVIINILNLLFCLWSINNYLVLVALLILSACINIAKITQDNATHERMKTHKSFNTNTHLFLTAIVIIAYWNDWDQFVYVKPQNSGSKEHGDRSVQSQRDLLRTSLSANEWVMGLNKCQPHPMIPFQMWKLLSMGRRSWPLSSRITYEDCDSTFRNQKYTNS